MGKLFRERCYSLYQVDIAECSTASGQPATLSLDYHALTAKPVVSGA